MKKMFPKPWRAEFCGDCYRVFDANDRELFVICGDVYDDPDIETVFTYGKSDEQDALNAEIERMFS